MVRQLLMFLGTLDNLAVTDLVHNFWKKGIVLVLMIYVALACGPKVYFAKCDSFKIH